jgi:hypothetical protein
MTLRISCLLLRTHLCLISIGCSGLELLFPMLSGTFTASYVLPPCGFEIPQSEDALTSEDQAKMVEAAVEAAPKNKEKAARD